MKTMLDYLNSYLKTPMTYNRQMRIDGGKFGTVAVPLPLFKKIKAFNRYGVMWNKCIASIEVPVGATLFISNESIKSLNSRPVRVYARPSIHHHKIRVSKALVVNIAWEDGKTENLEFAKSIHDPDFKYRIGKVVKPRGRFSPYQHECDTGIHGFLTLGEAKDY